MPDRDDRYEHPEDRWTNEGNGDRGGAGRTKLADYEGGYGGSRERAERWPEHGFGDRGWGGGRGHGTGHDMHSDQRSRNYPEGARTVRSGEKWDERYAADNANQYGQSGGQGIAQRGSSQSMGGFEHREQGLGDTRDVSARGAYGMHETERWGENQERRGNFAGRGPKNYKRSDERISEDIHRRLTEHPHVDASEIEVQVQNGVATLSGTVDDRHARWAAEDALHDIPGITEVNNNIRVRQSQSAGMPAGDPSQSRQR